MLNWKALSKNELKKELEAFKRKDLKALKTLMKEIEKEQDCAREAFIETESESEEEKKWERIWFKINDKLSVVEEKIKELEPIRTDRG